MLRFAREIIRADGAWQMHVKRARITRYASREAKLGSSAERSAT